MVIFASRRRLLWLPVALLSRKAVFARHTRPAGPVFRMSQFGGQPRPGFDNWDAFDRALTDIAARGGGDLQLEPGNYEVFAKSLLTKGSLQRPSRVAISGSSRHSCAIVVTGNTIINQLFDASGASGVLTRHLTLVGNGIKDEDAPYAGALLSAVLRDHHGQDSTDVLFEDCNIENFASAAWVFLENQSKRHVMQRCGSRGCNWFSRPGTSPGAGKVTVPGHFLIFSGFAGPVLDIVLDDAHMDARYIKGGAGFMGNVSRGIARIGELTNAGSANGDAGSNSDGPGSYAIFFYAKPVGAPRDISLAIDKLANFYSVGVYAAGATRLSIAIATASGQRDVKDGTLFKGLFAFQACTKIRAHAGRVSDCNRVVMVSLDGGNDLGVAVASANIVIDLEDVVSRAGARDVLVDLGGTQWAGGVTIKGRRSGPADIGIMLRSTSRFGLQDIDLSGLRSSGAARPIVIAREGGFKMRRIRLPPSP